eukprot:1923494-Pyramimonas_sp.AAC.1
MGDTPKSTLMPFEQPAQQRQDAHLVAPSKLREPSNGVPRLCAIDFARAALRLRPRCGSPCPRE